MSETVSPFARRIRGAAPLLFFAPRRRPYDETPRSIARTAGCVLKTSSFARRPVDSLDDPNPRPGSARCHKLPCILFAGWAAVTPSRAKSSRPSIIFAESGRYNRHHVPILDDRSFDRTCSRGPGTTDCAARASRTGTETTSSSARRLSAATRRDCSHLPRRSLAETGLRVGHIPARTTSSA